MFQKVNTPVIGIVENMSYFVCPTCGEHTEVFKGSGGESESKRLQVPLLGRLPLDPQLTISSDSGKPVVFTQKDSEVSTIFLEIACKVDKILV